MVAQLRHIKGDSDKSAYSKVGESCRGFTPSRSLVLKTIYME